jgi:hypothetical protein
MKILVWSLCTLVLSASAFADGEISFIKQLQCQSADSAQASDIHLMDAPILTHADQITNRSQIVKEPSQGTFELGLEELGKVVIFGGDSLPGGRNEVLKDFELAKINKASHWGVTLTDKTLVYSFTNSASGVYVYFSTDDLINRANQPILATVKWAHFGSDHSEGSFVATCLGQ